MRSRRLFYLRFLGPAALCFLFIFLYPTARTMVMSLFEMGFITDGIDSWSFVGFDNFVTLFRSKLFLRAVENILKIWFIGGAIVLSLAMLFSVIISSGIKGKDFWRAIVYLPHIISVVALVTMWTQYAFNNQYGFFTTMLSALGMEKAAAFQWTAPENLFLSMMIAYTYGSVGFYVLILVAGMDGIPRDYYEAAEIDGANGLRRFISITLPQLKDIIKRCIVLYSAGAIGFFAYSTLFSFSTEMATITPIVYMYDNVFGASTGNLATKLNIGAGAAVGVIVMVMVLAVNTLLDKLIPTENAGD